VLREILCEQIGSFFSDPELCLLALREAGRGKVTTGDRNQEEEGQGPAVSLSHPFLLALGVDRINLPGTDVPTPEHTYVDHSFKAAQISRAPRAARSQ
jgi:hypothetical protein